MHQYMHANSADQICWSILLEVEVEWISQPPPAVGKNYPMQMQAVVRRRLLDRRRSLLRDRLIGSKEPSRKKRCHSGDRGFRTIRVVSLEKTAVTCRCISAIRTCIDPASSSNRNVIKQERGQVGVPPLCHLVGDPERVRVDKARFGTSSPYADVQHYVLPFLIANALRLRWRFQRAHICVDFISEFWLDFRGYERPRPIALLPPRIRTARGCAASAGFAFRS